MRLAEVLGLLGIDPNDPADAADRDVITTMAIRRTIGARDGPVPPLAAGPRLRLVR
jgi:hypothetical protein